MRSLDNLMVRLVHEQSGRDPATPADVRESPGFEGAGAASI
ncbi:hypothetical protein [Natronomonas aquatica]|jgi:hypothetical protein|nr:hypothetical protein [Natronomonas aquatica]